MQQDRLIGAAGEGRYAALRGWAGRPEYGNSLLVRESLADHATRRAWSLGSTGRRTGRRSGCRVVPSVTVAVTHLHHLEPDEGLRDEQTRQLLEWIDAAPPADAQIVMGDFNAHPAEPTYARMAAAGFRSPYAEANGAEPAVTWPSGLQAPAMDTDGSPRCLDYIWIRGAVASESARLAFDRPDPEDPTLYPSRPPRASRPTWRSGRRQPWHSRLAHRGDWRRAPENTLAAFLAAIAVPGCDGLEFDVRASADGVPVVIHDETLERVQGVDARVDELSAEALERHGVPSLADVLAAVPRRAFLDVELKG